MQLFDCTKVYSIYIIRCMCICMSLAYFLSTSCVCPATTLQHRLNPTCFLVRMCSAPRLLFALSCFLLLFFLAWSISCSCSFGLCLECQAPERGEHNKNFKNPPPAQSHNHRQKKREESEEKSYEEDRSAIRNMRQYSVMQKRVKL
jgi:hypothetical protein